MNKNPIEPLVSICMPLYNAELYIYETLTKLNEQSYKNIEIVVVNDNSTDKSLEIAQSFSSDKIKIFTNPNKGACSARNYAFSKSNGEYIKFMDADDFCTLGLIEKQVETLRTLTKDDIVFSPLKMLYPDGKLILPERSIDKNYKNAFDLQIDILKFGGFNIPHCYLMPRKLVEDVAGWDVTILKNQDG
ncbi:MAG TPA: glycosyltransferase family 2 protein, partial [Arcobacter sp.]|nr:glycosyltransferase family 2 protein [Arcobacter sp.]